MDEHGLAHEIATFGSDRMFDVEAFSLWVASYMLGYHGAPALRSALERKPRSAVRAREHFVPVAIAAKEVMKKPCIEGATVLDQDLAQSLVMQEATTVGSRGYEGRIAQSVRVLTKISHCDDEVTCAQYELLRHRPVVVLELVPLEATTDCEVPGREQHIAPRRLVNVLARERESVFPLPSSRAATRPRCRIARWRTTRLTKSGEPMIRRANKRTAALTVISFAGLIGCGIWAWTGTYSYSDSFTQIVTTLSQPNPVAPEASAFQR